MTIRPAVTRFKLQTNLSTFMQSKHRIKLVALMLPLPTKATTEEKTNS